MWRLAEDGGLASASPLGTVSSLWPGMQRTPDAAFTWTNGLTYFFKDGKFWRFNDYLVITESELPRSSARVWFGC